MKRITTVVAIPILLATAAPAHSNELARTAENAQAVVSSYVETGRDIIFYALSLVGIHYRWGGSSPQTGFDCSGLVGHVFRQIAGMVLPRDSYAMARLGRPVEVEDLRPGDLVFFNTMRKPFSHVGIYLGDKRFVHAPSAGKSVHVVDMTEPYWANRFDGARRIDL